MKKESFKLLSLFMSLVLSTSLLAACSGGQEQTSTTENKSGDDTIKIGANLELSGNVLIWYWHFTRTGACT